MKSRNTLIALGIAAALAAGVGAYGYTAYAQGGPGYGPGWMMGGGYGPGMMGGGYGPGYHMRGWGGGPGPGAGPENCPAFGQNGGPGPGQQGYGPGQQGYGPGYHMRGGYGPGMMGGGYGPGYHMRGGYGPGMMGGYGPGYNRSGDAQNDQNAQGNQSAQGNQAALSTDDVKARVERWLAIRGNPRLKVGEVKEKDVDTITAEVVTKDNSLVERFIVNRHTGAYSRDNS